MVKGVGIDIELVGRFREKPYNKNKTFYQKIFTPAEIKYCQAKADPAQHFNARFAAKEAVVKALGEKKIDIKKIEVFSSKDGKPGIRFKNKDLRFKILISLSHARDYTVAVAIRLD